MTSVLFPPTASLQAVQTDRLFYLVCGISLAIGILVVGLLLVFTARYRHGSAAARGRLPPLMRREIEIGWTAGTLFLALFMFWWASSAMLAQVPAPANAMEVHVVARQWMWKTQHPSGAREINTLHVPLNQPTKLLMTSADVIHSFFVPAFRLKADVLPGRNTQLWFTATKTGTFHLFCAEFCGTEHSRMTGQVIVVPPGEYAAWSAAQPEGDDLGRDGSALFVALGCAGCHAANSRVRAPDLKGVYGRVVQLSDGRRVTADDAYLRDSILLPRRDVVAGFEPIMPSYSGAVSDDDLQKLVAYLKSQSAGAQK